MKLRQAMCIVLISTFFFSGCSSSPDETEQFNTDIFTENPATEITTANTVKEPTTEKSETTTSETIEEPTTEKSETTTSEPVKVNPIISNLHEGDIRSGIGNNLIGKYLLANLSEDSFTDNDLIEFYNYCKDNDSSYNYIIVNYGNGEGLWYSYGILSKNELEFDAKAGHGYLQHKTLGYYTISNDTVTYEPIE